MVVKNGYFHNLLHFWLPDGLYRRLLRHALPLPVAVLRVVMLFLPKFVVFPEKLFDSLSHGCFSVNKKVIYNRKITKGVFSQHLYINISYHELLHLFRENIALT